MASAGRGGGRRASTGGTLPTRARAHKAHRWLETAETEMGGGRYAVETCSVKTCGASRVGRQIG